eukprot:13469004-Heterocapsa_arctica.AAC.1
MDAHSALRTPGGACQGVLSATRPLTPTAKTLSDSLTASVLPPGAEPPHPRQGPRLFLGERKKGSPARNR